MQFPYGILGPDQTDLAPGLMLQADGVQPLRDGYGPFPSPIAATSATALSGPPRGMFSYQTADGTWAVVAATVSTVEKMAADFTWSAIDTGLAVAASDDMCFVRFGTKLLYTNTGDGMRAYDVEAGGAASAIAAAKNPRWMFECGNILFLLDCLDNLGNRNNRLIRSSAFSDHTNYVTKGADYQPLESGGALIWGGKISDTMALVLQQRAVRLIQVGNVGNALWGIQSISEEFGSVGAKSCISFDGTVWWWATDGLRKFTMGGGIERPFAGLMDKWFLDRVDQTDMSLIQGSIDPFRKNVMWRWKRASNASNVIFEDIIGYNWENKKPFTLTIQTTYLGYAAQTAITWDSYTGVWDSADLEWDNRLLQGGQPLFGALGPTFVFNYFAGTPLEATLETAINSSPVSMLIGRATPEDDSDDGTLELGVRNALNDTTTWKTGAAKRTSGRAPLRGRGKYVAFRRNIPAGSIWTLAKGVDKLEASAGGAE
jgi:hypothetical protein